MEVTPKPGYFPLSFSLDYFYVKSYSHLAWQILCMFHGVPCVHEHIACGVSRVSRLSRYSYHSRVLEMWCAGQAPGSGKKGAKAGQVTPLAKSPATKEAKTPKEGKTPKAAKVVVLNPRSLPLLYQSESLH